MICTACGKEHDEARRVCAECRHGQQKRKALRRRERDADNPAVRALRATRRRERYARDPAYRERAQAGVRAAKAKAALREMERAAIREQHQPRRYARWTSEERDELRALIERGYSYATIARELGRTRPAVVKQVKDIGYTHPRAGATLPLGQVAQLLGVGSGHTIQLWVTYYGLPARRSGTPTKPIYRVAREDLIAWLERPEHWMKYDPKRVTDQVLRAHLQRIRPGGPYWLTTAEVGRRLYVNHTSVARWIAQGDLPAVRYGNWWVCIVDLRTFTPPYNQRRRRQHQLTTI